MYWNYSVIGIHQANFVVVCKVRRKMKSSVKPFGCAVCRKGFVSSKSLADHIKRFHEYPKDQSKFGTSTGKSLSEALIFTSTNPQYDDRLFIELQVQFVKFPSSEYG